jgi:hypothetical protein
VSNDCGIMGPAGLLPRLAWPSGQSNWLPGQVSQGVVLWDYVMIRVSPVLRSHHAMAIAGQVDMRQRDGVLAPEQALPFGSSLEWRGLPGLGAQREGLGRGMAGPAATGRR